MNNEINKRISEILREEFDVEGINVEGYDSIEAVFDEVKNEVDEDDEERIDFQKERIRTLEHLYCGRSDPTLKKTNENENLILYHKETDTDDIYYIHSKKTNKITDVVVYDLYGVVTTPYGVAFCGEDELLFVDIDNKSYSDMW